MALPTPACAESLNERELWLAIYEALYDLTAVSGNVSLLVEWTDTSEIEDGFVVEWGFDGVTFPNSATVGPDETSYLITGLDFNQLVYVQVYAFTGSEHSETLGPIGVYTRPPSAPSNLVAVATGPYTADLNWDLPSVEPISGGYRIYAAFGEGDFALIGQVSSGETYFEATGLTDNSQYTFYLKAYNDNSGVGQQDQETDPSNEDEITTPPEMNPPVLVSATVGVDGDEITLVFDEEVFFGAGGDGGWTLTPSGGASAMTYSSGETGDTLVYALDRVIEQGETITISYVQPGDGVVDQFGNELQNITDDAVTNNSTVVAGPDFEWLAESTTAEVFQSDGTATLTTATISNEQAQSLINSLKCVGGFNYAEFSTGVGVQNLDWSKDAGTAELYVYYTIASGSCTPMRLETDTSAHNVRVTVNMTTGEAGMAYQGASSVGISTVSGLLPNQWNKLTAKWRTSGATPTLSLQRDAATPVTNSSALPALAGLERYLRFGNYQGGGISGGNLVYVDTMRIWKEWLV